MRASESWPDSPAVPVRIKDALARYVDGHIPTGGFLQAVLEGDLFEACARADYENASALVSIVRFIWSNVPTSSYGSPEKVSAWLARREP